MSSQISDENDDSYNELAHSLVRVSSRRDSGYLTFSSPCTASPSRLSPSSVVLHQLDSPIFEREPSSPVNAARQKFASTLDFEHYRSTRKHFDILTQIHHRNAHHLVDTILDNLASHDLQRCATVCRTWYSILKGHSRRKQAKRIKRDLFHLTNKTPRRKSKPTNPPMQTITNLLDTKPPAPSLVEPTSNDENVLPSTPLQPVLTSSPDKNVHLAASAMSFRYGYLKYLHGPTVPKRCPICAYVSIVDVNDQHGVCTNPLCRNSFCQCCSGPYHPSSPCKTTTGPVRSPWRRRPAVSPIFSNKTRSNLRRLLM